jgi:hypothetical protein
MGPVLRSNSVARADVEPPGVAEPTGDVPVVALAAVSAPAVAVLVLLAFVVGGEYAGLRPFAAEPSHNVAEAAAIGDAAFVQAFIVRGVDLDARWDVGRDLLDSRSSLRVTAVEAAILARQPALVGLLLRHGARSDSPMQTACLVRAVSNGGGGRDALSECGIPFE